MPMQSIESTMRTRPIPDAGIGTDANRSMVTSEGGSSVAWPISRPGRANRARNARMRTRAGDGMSDVGTTPNETGQFAASGARKRFVSYAVFDGSSRSTRRESIAASSDTSGREASSPTRCASVSMKTTSCGRTACELLRELRVHGVPALQSRVYRWAAGRGGCRRRRRRRCDRAGGRHPRVRRILCAAAPGGARRLRAAHRVRGGPLRRGRRLLRDVSSDGAGAACGVPLHKRPLRRLQWSVS
jgi:hypothetical protein